MKRLCRSMLLCCIAAGLLGAAGAAPAREPASRVAAFPSILASELPREGRETLNVIHKGGPFPYAKDGTIFSNRERILPKQPRGFYREYTVKTPRSRDRGARRIVCGGTVAKPQVPDTCYYTENHYKSFKMIKE